MALLDAASGRSPIKGYSNTQVVQRAAMAYTLQPVEMFAAARLGLSVANDIEVYQFDILKSSTDLHRAYSIEEISQAFSTRSARLRRLFWEFAVNSDTNISILYGADEFSGTYLISILRNSRMTTVTYVSTVEHDHAALGEKLKAVLFESQPKTEEET